MNGAVRLANVIFTLDGITPAGPVAATFQRFAVEHDGVALGWVTITPAGLVNAGISPASHIADRLNALVLAVKVAAARAPGAALGRLG